MIRIAMETYLREQVKQGGRIFVEEGSRRTEIVFKK